MIYYSYFPSHNGKLCGIEVFRKIIYDVIAGSMSHRARSLEGSPSSQVLNGNLFFQVIRPAEALAAGLRMSPYSDSSPHTHVSTESRPSRTLRRIRSLGSGRAGRPGKVSFPQIGSGHSMFVHVERCRMGINAIFFLISTARRSE